MFKGITEDPKFKTKLGWKYLTTLNDSNLM